MNLEDESFQEYTEAYIHETKEAIEGLNRDDIFEVADAIAYTQYMKGRLFIIGIGGSAANASHAVNDFRKLCDIDAICPTQGTEELTARINDSVGGWDTFFMEYLKTCNLAEHDTVMILSVSGGKHGSRISKNICYAVDYAKECGAAVVGIVGRRWYTYVHADACVVIPDVEERFTTPITESLQVVVLHLIATSPGLSGGKED